MTSASSAAPASPPANQTASAYLWQHLPGVVETLQTHWQWWVYPTGIAAVLALGMALFGSPTWRATQALVARDDALKGGRFDSVDAMKVFWETVQEVARSPEVAEATLKAIGPASGAATADWPSPSDVTALKNKVSVYAPNGIEFGRTEMIYLAIDSPSRDRAIALNKVHGQKLDARLRLLREERARSVAKDLEAKVLADEQALQAAVKNLEQVNAEIGADLGTLKVLIESGAGDSNLQQTLTQARNELRAAQTRRAELEEQLRQLKLGEQKPDLLIGTPNKLVESQPSLARLRQGIVESQIKAAELQGKMSADHPEVIAALEAVRAVRRNFQSELAVAQRGVAADLQLNDSLVTQLKKQEAEIDGKLNKLAVVQARYGSLVAEYKNRTQLLEADRTKLADARTNLAATSFLTFVGEPETGDNPLGPGRTTIVLGGIFGGLVAGLGLVFFVSSPIIQTYGRRWNDLLSGRRSSDTAPVETPKPADAPAAPERRAKLPGSTEKLPSPSSVVSAATKAAAPVKADNGDRRLSTDRRNGDRRT